MSARRSRKENIPAPAAQQSAPAENKEKNPVSAASRQGCCGEGVFSRKDTLMVVLYSVLLFFAMTVQTSTVSMILCVLAFLSLLGKKPLSRFEQRLSVPVLGLLAFAIVFGAAAIDSPFGANAQSEFYKFIAAFSLAVILLSRFERKHVPGLLWGGASVSSVIALISLDMSCGQVLFGPFNALMNALGTDYTSALPEYFTARVNGLYNDANVTACLFSLALFAALYLLKNSTCIWRRLAASLLAGINAVSLLAAAAPASSMVTQGDETAVALCLFSGLILLALDVLAGRRLEPVLSSHKKAALAAVGAVAVICAAYGVAALTVKGPYTFDSAERVVRQADLPAGTYTLTAPLGEDVRVVLLGQTAYEKLMDQYETLYDSTSGETEFTVPEGLVMTRWQLYASAGTVVERVELSPYSPRLLPTVCSWVWATASLCAWSLIRMRGKFSPPRRFLAGASAPRKT